MKSITLCIRYQNTLVNVMCIAKLQPLCWAMFTDWMSDLGLILSAYVSCSCFMETHVTSNEGL